MPLRDAHRLPIAAVVLTGGSSGIGKSFVSHIRRVDGEVLICNLSRRKPAQIEDELKLRHVSCDLSDNRSRRGGLERVLGILQEQAPPGRLLVINNAGAGGFGGFPQSGVAGQLAMIELNITAVVDVTATLLPLLRERGGTVMNVASVVAFQPTPYMATYGASKAFVLHWSRALRRELRGTGVDVMAVCPGSTDSEFHDRAGMERGAMARRFSQTADAVVAEAMRALERGRGHVVTGWLNKVQCAVAARLPLAWSAAASAAVLARYRSTRGESS